jgi:class 3 adenylate cyclase
MSPVIAVPETLYAQKPDGISLAYQVFGDGPVDLVLPMTGGVAIDLAWDEPGFQAGFEQMASFCRVVTVDSRGFGSSSRMSPNSVAAVETWSDDFGTVMDAAGVEKAAILGWGEITPGAMFFTATHPERVTSMVLVNAYARYLRSAECRWGLPEAMVDAYCAQIRQLWGTGAVTELRDPSFIKSNDDRRRWARMERLGASPDVAEAVVKSVLCSDVTDVLPAISTPTLVIARRGDRHVRHEHAGYLASRIPGASKIVLPGEDHTPFAGDVKRLLDEAQDFITGSRLVPVLDRVLATVLFTDIVDSTDHAAQQGDRKWREALNRYDEIALQQIDRFKGKHVKGTGDGTLATFDGPARAVECARAIERGVRDELGLSLRAGIHTGEVELRDDDVAGMAVHIAARVAAQAGAEEIVVSSTVKDLVVGSGIEFDGRGEHSLKGVPGSWTLFAVAG